MSGRKDYTYDFETMRRQLLDARLRQFQQQRAAAMLARREEARIRAQSMIAQQSSRRAEANRSLLEKMRHDNDLKVDASEREPETSGLAIKESASQVVPELHAVLERAQAELDKLAVLDGVRAQAFAQEIDGLRSQSYNHSVLAAGRHLEQAMRQVRQETVALADSLHRELESLAVWNETLAQDEAVGQYHHAAAAMWQRDTEPLLAGISPTVPLKQSLDQVREACERAKQLHDEAGLRKAKADVRNEFLRDVIDSLKAIGFFVADPSYADPNDPAGGVVVRAQRADEEVVTTVDLSDTVHSIWNGITDDHCKTGFVEYLREMQQRGVEIKPQRNDLAPPLRIEQGKLDLPHHGNRQAGK